jgi:hypothetical protein
VHYLGRRYRLRVTVEPGASPSCRLRGGYLEVTVQERAAQDVQEVMAAWFRHRASEVLRERMDAITQRLRWVKEPPPMRLQWMRVQGGQLLAARAHHAASRARSSPAGLHRLRRAS